MSDGKNKHYVAKEWSEKLDHVLTSPAYKELIDTIKKEYDEKIIYPDKKHIFRALKDIDYSKVKIVILGQDPYHGANQANGLAFAVNKGLPRPPSLRNILNEVSRDMGRMVDPSHSTLLGWLRQGVMLLNTSLTVQQGIAGSHSDIGWDMITDAVVTELSNREDPVIFMLWGNHAKAKASLIDRKRHAILESAHPSPFSAHKFNGCGHFSAANDILTKWGKTPIDWIEVD